MSTVKAPVFLVLALLVSADQVQAAKGLHEASTGGGHVPAGGQPWLEQLSWKPRAWLYHSFLTAAECEHLIDLARPSMAASSVVDPATGNSVLALTDEETNEAVYALQDAVRTSHGTFLSRYQDDVVTNIEDRLAAWTQFPVENGEDLQVLRYELGQKYDEHWDWFDKDEMEKLKMDNSNRVATVLMYLSDVEKGGETSFTDSEWLDEGLQLAGSPSDCARNKVFVQPRKGDALLFFDLQPDGQTGDNFSMHAGCPVIKGEKWSATKWIHTNEFGDDWALNEKRVEQSLAQIRCEDTVHQCAGWAKRGECQTNPSYMVGTAHNLGVCRKSCGACIRCATGDIICQRKNVRLMKQQV